jgi:integrase
MARDISHCIDAPKKYRMAEIPRSISWSAVGRMLDAVDRRTTIGRRDYAILLLPVTYGLRSREIAALRLDDLDWERESLRVPERKAGHSTAYPLSPNIGDAIVDYLKHESPESLDRHLFFQFLAPFRPFSAAAISGRAVGHGEEILWGANHVLFRVYLRFTSGIFCGIIERWASPSKAASIAARR